MPAPSYTYTLTNGTTADASQVMQNFSDILNGVSDGTKDLSINALTLAGTLTANGNTTIGNASGDDLTINASLASTLPIKTTNSYDIGSTTIGLRALYLGANSQTVNLKGSASMSATWSLTLPVTAGSANQLFGQSSAGTGVGEWKTVAVGTSGTDFAVAHSANTVTLNLPDAGASARGVVTTGSQTIAGDKTFTGDMTISQSSDPNLTITASGSSSNATLALSPRNSGGTIKKLELQNDQGTTTLNTTDGGEIGRITQAGAFTLGSSSTTSFGLNLDSNTDTGITWKVAGTNTFLTYINKTQVRFYVRDGDDTDGVYLAANGTSWTSASDARLKTNVETIKDALPRLRGIWGVLHNWISDPTGDRRPAVIAQQVNAVFPEAVDKTDPDAWGVRYTDLIPLLIQGVKELEGRVYALEPCITQTGGLESN